MRVFRLIGIAVLLAGCAHLNLEPEYTLANKPGKGVLVMSMTYTPDSPTFTLVYRPVGTTDRDALVSNTIPHPEDWKNPAGRLVVIELPAGQYEIFQWAGNALESRRPFSVPFTVSTGKATYIGNVHVEVRRERGTFQVTVTDNSDRDLPLFHGRYKNMKSTDVVTSISTVTKP
jgi:hypothetical protein